MATRDGMAYLISEVRAKTSESGTAIFTDERIEQLLDSNQQPLVDSQLIYKTQVNGSTTVYKHYQSQAQFLEGTASGTASVRLNNSDGSVVTNYSEYPRQGYFVFDTNTLGTAYYYTGNAYDLNTAIADAWEEKASYFSSQFDFQVEGRSFKKSQIVKHCLDMARKYRSQGSINLVPIYRGDMC
jgi:hypothetical protein